MKHKTNEQKIRSLLKNLDPVGLALVVTKIQEIPQNYPDSPETRRLFADMVGDRSIFHPSFVEHYIEAGKVIQKEFGD